MDRSEVAKMSKEGLEKAKYMISRSQMEDS